MKMEVWEIKKVDILKIVKHPNPCCLASGNQGLCNHLGVDFRATYKKLAQGLGLYDDNANLVADFAMLYQAME